MHYFQLLYPDFIVIVIKTRPCVCSMHVKNTMIIYWSPCLKHFFTARDDVQGGSGDSGDSAPSLKVSKFSGGAHSLHYWNVNFCFLIKQSIVITKPTFHIGVHLFAEPWDYSQLGFAAYLFDLYICDIYLLECSIIY